MKLRIKEHDLAILDRGYNKDVDANQYVVIVDDKDINFTEPNNGITPQGLEYVSAGLDDEAIRAGASIVRKGSTCVIGGDVKMYSDDSVYTINKGEAMLFVNETLGKLLLENGVAEELVEW